MGNRHSISAGKLLLETLIWVIIAVIGSSIIQALSIIAANYYYQGNFQTDSLTTVLFEHLNLMKVLQGFSTIALFVLPSIYISNKYKTYLGTLGFRTPNYQWFMWIILMYLLSVPLIQFIGEWNKNISFPASFSSIENFLKASEHQNEVLTKEMLKGSHWTVLIFNLIIIAALPAICEELFFRGILQQIFGKIFNNKHFAIWVTACIFSAIHMQFYGFFPRMLLGLILGYIYFYGKNMWYNIGFHFLNNGVVVILYFVMNVRHQNVDDLDKNPSVNTWYLSLIALILLMLTLRNFKQKAAISKPD